MHSLGATLALSGAELAFFGAKWHFEVQNGHF